MVKLELGQSSMETILEALRLLRFATESLSQQHNDSAIRKSIECAEMIEYLSESLSECRMKNEMNFNVALNKQECGYLKDLLEMLMGNTINGHQSQQVHRSIYQKLKSKLKEV